MKALCHRCWTSNADAVIDFEISQNPLCLACYEKRSKRKIEQYRRLLADLPPRKDIVIDAMITKMKGADEE